MNLNVKDEILSGEPLYRIKQGDKTLYDNVTVEMTTAMEQQGTPINKKLFDKIDVNIENMLINKYITPTISFSGSKKQEYAISYISSMGSDNQDGFKVTSNDVSNEAYKIFSANTLTTTLNSSNSFIQIELDKHINIKSFSIKVDYASADDILISVYVSSDGKEFAILGEIYASEGETAINVINDKGFVKYVKIMATSGNVRIEKFNITSAIEPSTNILKLNERFYNEKNQRVLLKTPEDLVPAITTVIFGIFMENYNNSLVINSGLKPSTMYEILCSGTGVAKPIAEINNIIMDMEDGTIPTNWADTTASKNYYPAQKASNSYGEWLASGYINNIKTDVGTRFASEVDTYMKTHKDGYVQIVNDNIRFSPRILELKLLNDSFVTYGICDDDSLEEIPIIYISGDSVNEKRTLILNTNKYFKGIRIAFGTTDYRYYYCIIRQAFYKYVI